MQKHKEIKDMGVIEALLNTVHVGRLGTITGDGRPMIKPLNFVRLSGRIYFHSGHGGQKMQDVQRDPRVCFEMDLPVALAVPSEEGATASNAGARATVSNGGGRATPCDCDYLYRSVIISGRARIVESEAERVEALNALTAKYAPGLMHVGFTEERLKHTVVVAIEIESITGKENLGKGDLREAALKAMENPDQLPVVLRKRV